MRLDKYINDVTGEGRSLIKKKIQSGLVQVNGVTVKKAEQQVQENTDQVRYAGKLLSYAGFHYYVLHKPENTVSATVDNLHQTVIDLLGDDIPPHIKKALFPVGRLDIDTEGLMLLTDDGPLAHELLAPGKHVEKDYLCKTALPVTDDMVRQLQEGVDIGEKELTKPAKISKIEEDNRQQFVLTITEGKFHQVKRMLHAVGNEIVYLKRVRMGTLELPKELPPGAYRALTEKETDALKKSAGKTGL